MLKVERLKVRNWRNIEAIDVRLPTASRLICLVGENGTGKSGLLELLSSAANKLGISPGIEILRGDPFAEQHDVLIEARISVRAEELVGQAVIDERPHAWASWDQRLILSSRVDDGTAETSIVAGGIPDESDAMDVASRVTRALGQRQETMYLYLDSDRSYPPKSINTRQYAEGLDRDWDNPQWRKGRAFRPTRTMYDEWMQYMLAKEGQAATRHYSQARRHSEGRGDPPVFSDVFGSFKDSISTVMPHLAFAGASLEDRTITFDTAGVELLFSQLSGGEREIAFLLGQIDRFGLTRGLLMLDEPELHLNPDLVRSWISYLRDTIRDGQVWIATHSLEAVEVAGREATVVLERDPGSRRVDRAVPLLERPVLEALSASVGSPAFSLSSLTFVFVEGERANKERERFFRLTRQSDRVRFIEAGGARQVRASLGAVRSLASESGHELRLGAVLDRDFYDETTLATDIEAPDVFVLPCHEIENYLLAPEALAVVLETFGRDPAEAEGIVLAAADRFAGAWVLGRCAARILDFPDVVSEARELAYGTDWATVDADSRGFAESLLAEMGARGAGPLLRQVIAEIAAYRSEREGPDLWRVCMGKEVLAAVVSATPTENATAYEDLVFTAWDEEVAVIPEAVADLRNFVAEL